MYLLLN